MAIEAIDLFCGAGGLTRGLLDAGVVVKAGFDVDEHCRYAYENNNDGAVFYHRDVSTVTGEELKKHWSKGSVRLLAGCAPCQPFSTAANASKTDGDPRYPLLDHFTRLVDETRPDLVTMENVPRVRNHRPFKDFVGYLQELGYAVSYRVVACQEFGVPQTRRRMVLMASLHGEEALDLRKTHLEPLTVKDTLIELSELQAGQRDVADPIHFARSLSELNLKRIRHSKPGGSWLDWPVDLRADCHTKPSGASYQSVYSRMRADRPAPTMTTQFFNFGTGRFGHPDEDRAITPREAAMLQSFPPNYVFVKPGDGVFLVKLGKMIGNAVPPRLGEAIGKAFVLHVKKSVTKKRAKAAYS